MCLSDNFSPTLKKYFEIFWILNPNIKQNPIDGINKTLSAITKPTVIIPLAGKKGMIINISPLSKNLK